jgi:hypothetical protein
LIIFPPLSYETHPQTRTNTRTEIFNLILPFLSIQVCSGLKLFYPRGIKREGEGNYA